MRSVLLLMAVFTAIGAGNSFAAEKLRPLVIAHRGASGYLPEHTLEAYALAIDQGADFIEPDFVSSKDGYLFARHENELSGTTDVAEKYPALKTKKTIDGRVVEGWFSEDLTFNEIKRLRAKERVPFRNQSRNGAYEIPSLAEVLNLRSRMARETGRIIGIYAELKHPAYFASIGINMEEALVSVLTAWALDRPGAPVFLQCFEAATVKKLAQMTAVPTILLLDSDGPDTTDAGLAAVAAYAYGIGPAKTMIVPVDKQGNTGKPTDLVERAHRAGLKVHAYTFRPEPQFLPKTYGGDWAKEYCRFAALGVDGLFTDTPDLALKAFRDSCPMSR
jgi:glycerophosphoryl diester phosphodiesterase